jgi:hypothetical protein
LLTTPGKRALQLKSGEHSIGIEQNQSSAISHSASEKNACVEALIPGWCHDISTASALQYWL